MVYGERSRLDHKPGKRVNGVLFLQKPSRRARFQWVQPEILLQTIESVLNHEIFHHYLNPTSTMIRSQPVSSGIVHAKL